MTLDPVICREAMLARDPRFDGRFFTAVTSTGVYCRPICPARPPKAENCVFMPSAAAAQAAGFRPCLRCRPETAPEIGAWRGTSNTVSRALALIEAGALDDEGVTALALRLGIGERQLRRLFVTHLGASPVAVAQTRRVFLAKQLLHDTSLPMTTVALASGFGSLRRFNETFRELFRRPPASLRRSASAPSAGSALRLTLSYQPPYAWNELLNFLAARAAPGVETVASGFWRRTISLAGAHGEVAVEHDETRSQLRAFIDFPDLSALPTIVARLRRVFDLAADPQVIDATLSRDPLLAPLVAARPGLRTPGAWDGFELGVRAIVGQQITVAAATRLIGAIVRRYGAVCARDGSDLDRLFPTPAVLAQAHLEGMPAARARAIRGFAAEAERNGRLFERGVDLQASVDQLRRLPGIGPWTAHYIAMRALREPDAFPPGDVGLLRALGGSGRPSPAEAVMRAEAWRPWRAYAALHLWTAGAAGPAGRSGVSNDRGDDAAAA